MSILFSFPNNDVLAFQLLSYTEMEQGSINIHRFPDGESNIQINSPVNEKHVFLLCSLDHPDDKAMLLLFFAQTVKDYGALSVTLIAPYLGYMRQDKRFHEGEAITSNIFATFLSDNFDRIITVDPHLHRHKSMSEIYTIPAVVVHAADAIVDWIIDNISNPVLIGPDEESDQWVSEVAQKIRAPYIVLTKVRSGDKKVDVSVPDVEKYNGHTPVLLDDIISTARTMAETVKHLRRAGMKPPICIGVHAVFAEDGYETLRKSGVEKIVSCNSILHETNKIDLSKKIIEQLLDR